MTRHYRTYPAHADAPVLALLGALLGGGLALVAGALGAMLRKGKR